MRKLLYNFRIYILGVTLALFVLELVFIKGTFDLSILLLMAFWILNVVNYKLNYKFDFMIGMVILALVPLSLIFKFYMLAEKMSIWSYAFFIFALAQKFFVKGRTSYNRD
ncbi:hypothetical protein A3H26_02145 [candidate division WWE3 bacterium RIFCSPLOWO2_12_FULL_36_10]|uniref:Uncharacterized protein n=1 Tax=candidate division WWE3 bacterium RIFCSPLOWO2_12_FULL_36_10 TaxID=1802630 RepID=A0A1F4VJ70_UNCKA|nr:MAG: hypothetical protein A3H26_02145 [candidate division WWE3 bacterium RIFCSPLOWO2_12_FULL_36_10]